MSQGIRAKGIRDMSVKMRTRPVLDGGLTGKSFWIVTVPSQPSLDTVTLLSFAVELQIMGGMSCCVWSLYYQSTFHMTHSFIVCCRCCVIRCHHYDTMGSQSVCSSVNVKTGQLVLNHSFHVHSEFCQLPRPIEHIQHPSSDKTLFMSINVCLCFCFVFYSAMHILFGNFAFWCQCFVEISS